MKNSLRSLCALSAVVLFALDAEAQLRVVAYNTLDGPTDASQDAEVRIIFEAIANKSINGIAKRPDVIALQEQRTTGFANGMLISTASRIADELNDLFGVSTYEPLSSGTGSDLLMYVYDSSAVTLGSTLGISSDGPRNTLRADFKPVGYDSDDATLYFYNTHMKAGSSGSDISDRLSEANAIRANSDALGSSVNAIYLGDTNIGSSSESTYAALRASGNGQAFDPLLLASWPNFSVAEHLTQSTRTSSFGGGAGGGLDDRFDLQLITDDLLDGEGLSYVGPSSLGLEALDHSYQAFGNDGVSYNQAINNTLVGRSQPASVINALFEFSDHLPVVVDYQLPAVLDVITAAIPSTLQLDEVFELDVTVSNGAAVVSANGADELDYVLGGSGDVSGIGSGTEFALGAGTTHTIAFDTSSIGMKTGSVFVTTTSEGAANATQIIPISYEVLGAAFVPGDFTGDGSVDNNDLNLLLANWGSPNPPVPSGWDGDQPIGSSIDNDELNRLLANWGTGTAAIPEPSALLTLAFGLLALRRRA